MWSKSICCNKKSHNCHKNTQYFSLIFEQFWCDKVLIHNIFFLYFEEPLSLLQIYDPFGFWKYRMVEIFLFEICKHLSCLQSWHDGNDVARTKVATLFLALSPSSYFGHGILVLFSWCFFGSLYFSQEHTYQCRVTRPADTLSGRFLLCGTIHSISVQRIFGQEEDTCRLQTDTIKFLLR